MQHNRSYKPGEELREHIEQARERVSKWPRWILERSGLLEEFGLLEWTEEDQERFEAYGFNRGLGL